MRLLLWLFYASCFFFYACFLSGMLAGSLPGKAFAGTLSPSFLLIRQAGEEFLCLFEPDMPRTDVHCKFVSAMNVQKEEAKPRKKNRKARSQFRKWIVM